MSYIVKEMLPDTKVATMQCTARSDISLLPTQTRQGAAPFTRLFVNTGSSCLCTEDWSIWVLKENGKYGEYGTATEV